MSFQATKRLGRTLNAEAKWNEPVWKGYMLYVVQFQPYDTVEKSKQKRWDKDQGLGRWGRCERVGTVGGGL